MTGTTKNTGVADGAAVAEIRDLKVRFATDDAPVDAVKGIDTVKDDVVRSLQLFLAHKTFASEMGGTPRRGLLFEGQAFSRVGGGSSVANPQHPPRRERHLVDPGRDGPGLMAVLGASIRPQDLGHMRSGEDLGPKRLHLLGGHLAAPLYTEAHVGTPVG